MKRILAKRRWTFRNAARMNQLLELVRIRYNDTATETDFIAALCTELAEAPRPPLAVWNDPRLHGQRVSSSSLRAWMPNQPARHRRSKVAAAYNRSASKKSRAATVGTSAGAEQV